MEIVCIDHDQKVLDSISALFSGDSAVHTFTAFTRFEDSLQYLRSHRVDLVIMDADHDEPNWMIALRRIRAIRQKTRVVLLSHSGDSAVKAHEAGVWDYLLKPVKPQQLQRILAKSANPPSDGETSQITDMMQGGSL